MIRGLGTAPFLLSEDEAAKFLRTTADVVAGLVEAGQLAPVTIPGDPTPKFTPESLVDLIEKASGDQ